MYTAQGSQFCLGDLLPFRCDAVRYPGVSSLFLCRPWVAKARQLQLGGSEKTLLVTVGAIWYLSQVC